MNNFSRLLVFVILGCFVLNFYSLKAQQFYIPQKSVKEGVWEGKRYEYIANDLIIILKDPLLNQSILKSILKKFDAKIVLDLDKDGCCVIRLPEHKIEFVVAKELEKEEYIKSVEPVQVGRLHFSPNDPKFVNGKQWNLYNYGQSPPGGTPGADIKIMDAWDITRGDSNILVAVLDTGLPLDNEGYLWHEDLNGDKITIGTNFTVHGTIKDHLGHGTHVLGIIAAETNNNEGISGIAHNCSVIVHKAADDDGQPVIEPWVKQAIDQAVEDGSKVINCSFGFPNPSPYLQEAIENAHDNSVTIVASAGNYTDDFQYQVWYPARYSLTKDNVIAVAATDHKDERSLYSCYGSSVNIAAPGGYGEPYDENDILSTYPPYEFILQGIYPYLDTLYGYLAGTSMAAPQVTGLVALILSVNDELTPLQIRDIIENTADDVALYIGHGRINAYEALKYTLENYGGNISGDAIIGGENEVWTFEKSITVDANGSLTIRPGTTIGFASYRGLYIYGNLIADGSSSQPITFKGIGTSGKWNGIYFASSSDGDMEYCNIRRSQAYGGSAITINDSDPTLEYCTIYALSGYCYGISATNTSAPFIYRCTIRSNSAHGIYLNHSGAWIIQNNITANTSSGRAAVYCYYYANPLFAYPSYPYFEGRNTLENGYYGLYGGHHSNISAGSSGIAYNNRFINNTYANAYATNSTTISARYDWWGEYPPDESKIKAVNGSVIYFDHPQQSDPGASSTPPLQKSTGILAGDSNSSDQLLIAYDLAANKEYSQSVVIYKSIIADDSKSEESQIALTQLGFIFKDTKDESLIEYFKEFTTADHPLRTTAIEILANSYSFLSNSDEALKYNSLLIEDYPESVYEMHGLVNSFFIYLNLDQFALAEEICSVLNKKYPEEESSAVVTWILNCELNSDKNEFHVQPEQSISRSSSESITPSNYPNPFNPATTISFNLPQSAPVEIIVYDIQGRVIKKLLDAFTESGTHTVSWDGRNEIGVNVASGVYVYQLKTMDFVLNKKMLLVR